MNVVHKQCLADRKQKTKKERKKKKQLCVAQVSQKYNK
tara:strand:- start:293 stop:406 length:114 start_codon:yes stop_codon:yes gene_type:complete